MRQNGWELGRRWRALTDRFGNLLTIANALVLMLASWAPGSYVVRSGIFSGHVEHTVAYALSGALMHGLLARRWAARQVALMLAAYAGILEAGQIFAPGRHASLDDFLFSAAGAIAGVLTSAALHKARPSRRRARRGA